MIWRNFLRISGFVFGRAFLCVRIKLEKVKNPLRTSKQTSPSLSHLPLSRLVPSYASATQHQDKVNLCSIKGDKFVINNTSTFWRTPFLLGGKMCIELSCAIIRLVSFHYKHVANFRRRTQAVAPRATTRN